MIESEFQEHQDLNDGFCKVCEEFTREGDTEPDAEGYKCPECGGMTVVGAELALLMGLIELDEDC